MGLSGHHGPRTEVRADSAPPPALNELDQRPLYIGLKLVLALITVIFVSRLIQKYLSELPTKD